MQEWGLSSLFRRESGPEKRLFPLTMFSGHFVVLLSYCFLLGLFISLTETLKSQINIKVIVEETGKSSYLWEK